MPLSLHERVARAMKASHSAGLLNTYPEILARLKAKFPTEDALQAYIAGINQRVSELTGATVTFPADEIECQHCSRLVLLNERGITCEQCGATTAPRP
jgi:hypothetical protein